MKHDLFLAEETEPEKGFIAQQGTADVTFGDIFHLFSAAVKAKIRRSVVLCLCTQTAACVAGFLALEQADAVPFLLGKTLTKDHLVRWMERFSIQYLWIPAETAEKMLAADDFAVLCAFRDYLLVEKCGAPAPPCGLYPELALLLPTSGSTGAQKVVRLSKDNLRASLALIQEIAGFNQKDVGLVYLPVEHCFTIGLIHALYHTGAKIVCASNGILEAGQPGFMDKNQISVLISVTYIIDLLRKTDFFQTPHPTLRIIANGAGATPRETQDFLAGYLERQGGRLIPTYGQTEVTIVASALPAEALHRVYHSIGKPYGDVVMTIENPDKCGIGELVIRSAAVMLGYASCAADLSLGNVTGNVIHTGDLARRDEEGYYYIKGRKARFAKLYGERISLQYLEEELSARFPDCEFACVSNDETIAVVSTAAADRRPEILQAAARIAGVHSMTVTFVPLPAIPRKETGKVQYFALQKLVYGGGGAHA